MTQTNAAAAANETNAPAPKPESKMSRARAIYQELSQVEKFEEGDSIRKQFIKRAMADVGLTESGAQTYYNSLRKEAQGGDLYWKPKKAATVAQVQGAEGGEQEEAQDPQAQAGDDENKDEQQAAE